VLAGWAPEQFWTIFWGIRTSDFPAHSETVSGLRYTDYAVPTMVCRLCYTQHRLRYTNYAVPTMVCRHAIMTTLHRLRYTDYASQTTLYRLRYTNYAIPSTLYRLRCTDYALPTTLYRLRYTNSDKERTESEKVLRLYQTIRRYISQDRNFSRILTVWGEKIRI
jgi:hypothetical protein